MPDPMIRQLTEAELADLEKLCLPLFTGGVEAPISLAVGDLASLLNEIKYRRGRAAKDGVLSISSLVSMRDKKPYVALNLGASEIQLSALDAIAHAKRILQVATGAQADAFITGFLQEKAGITHEAALSVLHDFRLYRERVLGDDAPDNLDPDAVEHVGNGKTPRKP